jgi:N6-adenosine-specific RNA methylase IME4
MAHTDTCKNEMCMEIERRKEAAGGVRPAIREVSREYGIPACTLKRWVYPETDYRPKRTISGPLNNNFQTCAETELQNLIDSGRKFKTIYADPPWKYSNQATRSSTNNHYQTLTVEEISRLPIKDLSEEKAHLHLWTTNAFLFDSKAVMEAWGFEYKSCFIWVKPQLGIGNYWRLSHEFLLLGVRGAMTFSDHSLKSWLEVDRTKHSKKPEAVRELIEKASPGPYLELFGRRTCDNWTVWWNEIERELFNEEAFRKTCL